MTPINQYNDTKAPIPMGPWMISLGRMWEKILMATGIATATTVDSAIVTGAKEVHMSFNVISDQDFQTLSLIEGSTISGGTQVYATQLNRNKSATPLSTLFTGVTSTADGTTILTRRLLKAGQSLWFGPYGLRNDTEIILKPNTTYVIRLLTGAAASNNVDFSLQFYENTVNNIDKSESA